jgi:hypothetical protein
VRSPASGPRGGPRFSSRAAPFAFGLLCALAGASCRTATPAAGEPRRAAETITPEPPVAPSAPPGVAAVQPPPSASALPAPHADCKVHIAPVEFMEANPHPTQLDYPEVWTYNVDPVDEPATEAGGCLPAHVTLGVSGWQAISDLLLAKVGYDPAHPREATLTLERVEGSILGFNTPPGTLLATVVFDKGEVHEMRFGPGLPSRTHVRSLPARAPF